MTNPSAASSSSQNIAPEVEQQPDTVYPAPHHPWPTIEHTLLGINSYLDDGMNGVRVVFDETARHADILLAIPTALPTSSREQLKPFTHQRVHYTPADADHDAQLDPADEPEWEMASNFAHAVSDACVDAEGVLLEAVMAMANGLEWTNKFWVPPYPLRQE